VELVQMDVVFVVFHVIVAVEVVLDILIEGYFIF
jgi:hypothetical protein